MDNITSLLSLLDKMASPSASEEELQDLQNQLLTLGSDQFGKLKETLEALQQENESLRQDRDSWKLKYEETAAERDELAEKYNATLQMLDETMARLEQSGVYDHMQDLAGMYSFWDMLDNTAQKFLYTAEYLFSTLASEDPNYDLAPIIVELCRTVEYEWLYKVFANYVDIVKNIDDTAGKHRHMLKAVRTYRNQGVLKLTLGEMQTALVNSTKSNKTVYDTALIRYLQNDWNYNTLTASSYTNRMQSYIKHYRNASAHVDSVSLSHSGHGAQDMPYNYQSCKAVTKDLLQKLEESKQERQN